ncbi:S1 RNA-binding domain-containing protein [Streptomyces avicenniae]|uniref:S1 RNA-binding domain-containing protein n=1 Tax=Streptomyces avicenniae TaxID=500153 RepID=UPI00069AB536|nr:S1 RNA-binding domain-containing protein [Streptomyces avicenniae]
MGAAGDDQASRAFLATLRVGDVCRGTATEVTSSRAVTVTLDGFPARPLGTVGPLDLSWRGGARAEVRAGQRITAEVIAVDHGPGLARLSMAATENPALWAFLAARRSGEMLSGTVAAIERFGVFVALDDGPRHPVLPGAGFVTVPDLSWRRVEDASDVVRLGERVTCAFLHFDTSNGEARLSLRATRPDPFLAVADGTAVGARLRGRVTKLAPIGAFVLVAEGVEGLVPLAELAAGPVDAPEDVVLVGDEIPVVVTGIDRERRALTLSLRRATPRP